MNFKNILAALMLSVFTMGVANAAGSPINEDFTALKELANKMIEAGNAKDKDAFINAATEASAVAKDQGNKGNSPILQRISTKFKVAKKAVKGGDFATGIKQAEESITEMDRPKPKLNFGGGSEKREGGLY